MPAPPEHKTKTDRPMINEISPPPLAAEVFERLARLPGCIFLDSAQTHPELGRYSYVTADPFATIRVPSDSKHPLHRLEAALNQLSSHRDPELPPFQGGAAGLFAYELGRSWETIASPRTDEFHLPALAVGLYDVVIAFDHQQQRCWIVSQGWPERDVTARRQRASDRLEQFRSVLDQPIDGLPSLASHRRETISIDQQNQHHLVHVPGKTSQTPTNLLSNFSANGFKQTVEKAIEYIHAGDVFQVNLAQRLIHPQSVDSVSLYQRLRAENPAPFAGYFDMGDFQIVSASPERFLKVNDGSIETRPIKGTRQRVTGAEADLFTGDELKQSEKDLAENVMIVDLMRNDLSRVCDDESVIVNQLCSVETYQYVQHLVSSVTGQLLPDCSPFDLLRAAFPGGSITGAPKLRAMQIISELEPHARGAYCGSLGYLTCDGQMDLSILIRTITAGGGWWQLPVGGGIVSQSEPTQEYAETWHKAEGLLRAIL
ncbi:MAG: aminodeoxychorismate synthase component I [Pirellulaceae bacterium]|nr:aminodeoxychorismate synthase component I [Pirellulaceae bacterium]